MEFTPVHLPGPPGFIGGTVRLKLSLAAYATTSAAVELPSDPPHSKSLRLSQGQGVADLCAASFASSAAASRGKNDYARKKCSWLTSSKGWSEVLGRFSGIRS